MLDTIYSVLEICSRCKDASRKIMIEISRIKITLAAQLKDKQCWLNLIQHPS